MPFSAGWGVESEGHVLSIDGNCEKPTSSRAAQGPRAADLIVSGRLTWIAARPGSFLPQKSCGARRINRTGCSVQGEVFVRAAAAINVPGMASRGGRLWSSGCTRVERGRGPTLATCRSGTVPVGTGYATECAAPHATATQSARSRPCRA